MVVLRKCPKCREMVNAQSVACPRCGVNFREHRTKRVMLCLAAIAVAGFAVRSHFVRHSPVEQHVAAQH